MKRRKRRGEAVSDVQVVVDDSSALLPGCANLPALEIDDVWELLAPAEARRLRRSLVDLARARREGEASSENLRLC